MSNPPYIPLEEMKNIMIDVKEYEPEIALTDFNDGLVFYDRFADLGSKLLKKELTNNAKSLKADGITGFGIGCIYNAVANN